MDAFHIREDKWHYRLHNTLFDPDSWFEKDHPPRKRYPKTLCRYFWATVGAIVLISVLAIPAALLIGVIIAGYYISRAIQWAWNKRPRRKKNYWKNESKVPKEPGMVKVFFQTKKNKVCPIIIIDKVEND